MVDAEAGEQFGKADAVFLGKLLASVEIFIRPDVIFLQQTEDEGEEVVLARCGGDGVVEGCVDLVREVDIAIDDTRPAGTGDLLFPIEVGLVSPDGRDRCYLWYLLCLLPSLFNPLPGGGLRVEGSCRCQCQQQEKAYYSGCHIFLTFSLWLLIFNFL